MYGLTCLAAQGGDPRMQSHDIAQACGLPERYLLKLLTLLVRAGILSAGRGPAGGYRLARPAGRISLLDVVQAVEGPLLAEVLEVGSDKALHGRLREVYVRATDAERRVPAGVRLAVLVTLERNTRNGAGHDRG
jgi:Rrf2 family protein